MEILLFCPLISMEEKPKKKMKRPTSCSMGIAVPMKKQVIETVIDRIARF